MRWVRRISRDSKIDRKFRLPRSRAAHRYHPGVNDVPIHFNGVEVSRDTRPPRGRHRRGSCPGDATRTSPFSPSKTRMRTSSETHFLTLLSRSQASGQQRIVNGDMVVGNQFQYFTLVQMTNGDICGGALITNMTVVTAAHCIERRYSLGVLLDLRPLLSTLRIGCTSTSDRAGTRWCQERNIEAIHIHPGWDGNLGPQAKDIAILTLDQPVKLNPVPLAESTSPLERAEVVGYGQTSDGMYTGTMRYTEQYIETVEGSSLITAGDESGPCYGDSGSPLVTARGLVGLVSYGTDTCDSVTDEDGYFYVPSEREWIEMMATTAPPADEDSNNKPVAAPPPINTPPSSVLKIKDGVYTLQVVTYGSCRGKFLAVGITDGCGDRRLRLYSSSTVRQSQGKKKKKKNKDKKNKKKKGKKGGRRSAEATMTKTEGRSLLATRYKYKPAASWKIVTKPSDGSIYIESIARGMCVAPFVQMTPLGSTLLGPINQGWILEKAGSKYVRLLSADTYTYVSSFTGRCDLQSAKSNKRGTALKFKLSLLT